MDLSGASEVSKNENAYSENSRSVKLLIFGLLLVSYAYFFQGGGWNPNSRLDLTRALSEHHTTSIDAYRNNTSDWALREGRYYTNKAPGLSLISAPVFFATGILKWLPVLEDENRLLLIRAYLTNVVVNGLPSALMGLLFFSVLRHLGLVNMAHRAWASIAFGLGTMAFPYTTAYYGHQLAAVLSLAAFTALLKARAAGNSRLFAILGGAASGGAIVIEASSALTVLVLAAIFLSDRQGLKLIPHFILGALPFAIIMAAYNWIAFGGPFQSSYAYANPRVMLRREGRLFGLPSMLRLHCILVSPYRGVFFTSPLLALAPFGWYALYRNNKRAALLCLIVPLGFIAANASFFAWYGGWAPGPRYLIPGLPFLFIPAVFAMVRIRILGGILTGLSVAIMLSITLVAVEVPSRIRNPLFDFIIPHLTDGRVSVNSQGLDDIKAPYSYHLGHKQNNWNSFNLGELLWPHSVASVIPLLVIWGILGTQLYRLLCKMPRPPT